MKRFFSFYVLIAFLIYVSTILLVKLAFKGYQEFSESFSAILIESVIAGFVFILLFFGVLWLNLSKTLGYIESDSFEDPEYGHTLNELVETPISDFNKLKERFLAGYTYVKVSDDKLAIKFHSGLSWKHWGVGGIAYFNAQNGAVRIVLIPFSGYSISATKLMEKEMKRVRDLLLS